MRRLVSLAFLPALALAACGPVNKGIESANQPIVTRADYVFDVAAGGYGLAPGEAQRVAAWFDSLDVGFGDRITVDDPAHYGGGGARDDVAAAAARHGLLLGDSAPVTEGSLAPGMVRVVVSRAKAGVPDCPAPRRDDARGFNASTSADYGCSMNSNLAAMVADPQDLLHGHSAEPDGAQARVASKALKAFREAAPTGAGGQLKTESAGGGR